MGESAMPERHVEWENSYAANDDEASYEKWPPCLHSNRRQHRVGAARGDQMDQLNEDLHFQRVLPRPERPYWQYLLSTSSMGLLE